MLDIWRAPDLLPRPDFHGISTPARTRYLSGDGDRVWLFVARSANGIRGPSRRVWP